jgi:hypothetical protein
MDSVVSDKSENLCIPPSIHHNHSWVTNTNQLDGVRAISNALICSEKYPHKESLNLEIMRLRKSLDLGLALYKSKIHNKILNLM